MSKATVKTARRTPRLLHLKRSYNDEMNTRDAQFVFVGSECFKFVHRAGRLGWQPPSGGPRLYRLPSGLTQHEIDIARRGALEAC